MPPEQKTHVFHLSDDLVQRIQYGREQSRVLVFHARYFVSHLRSRVDPADLRNVTRAVDESVTGLSQKSLPWSLIRRQSTRKALLDVKDGLRHAFIKYDLDVDSLETDFIKAQQQDHENLKTRCRTISRSPTLATDLVAAAAGDHYELKELATVFTKHASRVVQSRRHITDEVDSFIATAAAALQQAAGRSWPSSSAESERTTIPNWCLTRVEVDFDIDDEKRLVGRGAFGRVVEGMWWGGDGAGDLKPVAVKALYVKTGHEADRRRAEESFRNEVHIWSRLSHPNILPFYGACLESAQPFIISPLCTSGNALIYLYAHANADRVRLLHDVSLGMIYLHSLGIIHGDLKATNILLSTSYTTTAPRALIADFGLSIVHDSSSFPSSLHFPSGANSSSSSNPTPPSPTSTSTSPSSFFKSITRTPQREKKQSQQKPVGTPRWMAPEVILGKGLSPPADVYGFGMVAWEVVSVRPGANGDGNAGRLDADAYNGLPLPFATVHDPYTVCQLIVQGDRPERPLPGQGMPNQRRSDEDRVWDVIERCWKPEPASRPDFRWVEAALRGVVKRMDERAAGAEVGKKKKKILDVGAALKRPWRRATVDVVVGSGGGGHSSAVALDGQAEATRVDPPARPRRPSFLKALVSLNLSILTFSKSPASAGAGADGTKHFEWHSRNRDDTEPRKSTASRPTNLPDSSDIDLLVSSAQALPSISRSSSLSRSNSQSGPGKLRRRRRIASLDTAAARDAKEAGDPGLGLGGGLGMAGAVLRELFNLSLTSEGGVEIVKDGTVVPPMLRQLSRPSEVEEDQEEREERYLTSGILANLACHGNARAYLVAQTDLIPALMSSLSSLAPVPVQENATRCLYNLSTSSQSHHLFVPRPEGGEGFVHAMAKLLLSTSAPLNAARNILGCLTNLSHKQLGRSTILSIPEVLDSLVGTLMLPQAREDDAVEEVAKEQALMCLGNLSVDERGIMTLLDHPDLILGLATSLGVERRKDHPIKAQALRCLRNIARSASNHADILCHRAITCTVSEVLGELSFSVPYTAMRTVSTNEQKYALHFLHRISGSETGRVWLKKEVKVRDSGVRNGLRWFVENGTTEEQMRAGECLRVCGDAA